MSDDRKQPQPAKKIWLKRRGSGLTDKLYWRFVGNKAHCFKKCADGGYLSLCGHWWIPRRINGQSCSRPISALRCGRCDNLEAARRGHNAETLPESPDGEKLLAIDVEPAQPEQEGGS